MFLTTTLQFDMACVFFGIVGIVCFGLSMAAPMFQKHVANEQKPVAKPVAPEETVEIVLSGRIACTVEDFEDMEDIPGHPCPFCDAPVKRDSCGDPFCSCDDFMMANDLCSCIDCNIVYYGWACPICKETPDIVKIIKENVMNDVDELTKLQEEATPANLVECAKCVEHDELHLEINELKRLNGFLVDVSSQAATIVTMLEHDPSIAPDPTLLKDELMKLKEYMTQTKYAKMPGIQTVNHGG